MPPQTRSSVRTTSVTTRASLPRTQASKKAEESSKVTPKPTQKAKAAPKPKLKPKQKVKIKAEPDPEPVRKRVRRSGPKHAVQANKALEKMLLINLPVEVLIEIARYVHPLDLIMLSRVNKFFRELFMDKRSALIWQSARENLPGLPPCPEEVCEPQYAAMLFAKRCSSCGGYAPREMNPVLMIRLCSYCWEEELVNVNKVTDSSLVSIINGPVPGQSRSWRSWCLYSEARAVKVKLNELTEAADEAALQQWREERHKIVEARRKKSEPLAIWLVNRERERARDRNDMKVAHQKEIESRLIKLGWERGDLICCDGWRRKQWNSMMYTTKALTDKVWDGLLPRLLVHLEVNREQRLEREKSRRQATRSNTIYRWFSTVRDQLPPYARTSPMEEGSDPGTGLLPPVSVAHPIKLLQAFPSSSQAYECPGYQGLIENDIPNEQFQVDFEARKPEFQQLIVDWRHRLETQLIAALPDDTRSPNFDLSPLSMTIGTSETGQPLNTLSEDNQKLLRADTIFTTSPVNDHSRTYFYPHSFNSFGSEITNLVHHSKAHEIARALLSTLGIPDASYLGLKALGMSFRCGRCPQAMATGQSWRDIITHYLESIRSWKVASRQHQVRSNKNFVYVCTHDVDLENPDRPLVQISTEGNTSISNLPWTHSKCQLCQSVGLYSRMRSQAVIDHVRDVHLIEEPEAGVHYMNE
ncbi:unnamed protein product [Rhizoctonia solani]|uniref:F-box domain-containing protein n=1 Tax=Rhizoctonia solani TaxID=456999 RepID=A0A8H3AHT5_9AGAM|nr:unnamed protein product [Rhizoctonia solani]